MFTLNEPTLYTTTDNFNEFSGCTGYRPGIDYKGGIAFYDDTLKNSYRVSFYNKSIVEAYNNLFFLSDSIKRDFILTPGRLILNVKDSSKYIYSKKRGLKEIWNQNHTFCYEMVSSKPPNKTNRIKKVLQDLNLKLGLDVKWEKRFVNCTVIYKANPTINPDTVSIPKEPSIKMIFSAIPMLTFDMLQKYPPAVNETGYNGYVYLSSAQVSDGSLRKQLQRYGFDYKEEKRKIEVMVISEK
jgi:hypothetical protein